MDLESNLIKKINSEINPLFFDKDTDHPSTDDEDPYSFNSTSTSLIGLAIVSMMLFIPILAVISEKPEVKKSFIPTSINQNGPESSPPFTVTGISKSSC